MLLKFSLKLSFSLLGLLAFTLPASAAEQLVLTYGPLSRSFPVSELRQLADTGEASPSLGALLRTAGKDPQDFQKLLNSGVAVQPRVLDQALNNPLGEAALGELSEGIRPAPNRPNPQALRAALVLSASQRQPFSLVDVIENYPTQEVYVDGRQIQRTYTRFQGVIDRVQAALSILR
ncbi:alpha/beta hydrolase [Leptolyngbya sp. FACHB-261]|uniref:alpha/beta hydrolase n=1 Tax=Leptolyngbya sp. FACHB-261 TaxID=2692806 RepID=UPI0016855CFA|nr:alpha/beta hydrolase [Leptolyngbya sp. FACHB-261]MBD2103198.1 alpha/beta hydrolase [Leptolyngbya sp. FACHB-261]